MRCEWCQSLDYEVVPNGIYELYICRNNNCKHEWVSVTTDRERLILHKERSERLFHEISQKIRGVKHEEDSDL